MTKNKIINKKSILLPDINLTNFKSTTSLIKRQQGEINHSILNDYPLDKNREKLLMTNVDNIRKDLHILKDTILDNKNKNLYMKHNNINNNTNISKSLSNYTKAMDNERLGTTKRKICGLCNQMFLDINLPLSVSFKCIMDIHKKWNYIPTDVHNPKYKPPLCYNYIKICYFCEQIVRDQTLLDEKMITNNNKYNDNSYSNDINKNKCIDNDLNKQNIIIIPNKRKNLIKKRNIVSPQTIKSLNRGKKDILNDNKSSSDPFSLPPLIGDECDDTISTNDVKHTIEYLETPQIGGVVGKLIVYANQQLTNETSMSMQEWNIIKNNTKSNSLYKVFRQRSDIQK